MHPQQAELRAAIERFLSEPDASLTVHCPDKRVTATLLQTPAPRRLFLRTWLVPRVRTPAPRDSAAQLLAERLGFKRVEEEKLDPFTRQAVRFANFEADFSGPDEGAARCLTALQDIHGIGDAWLWITDLDYDDWPNPLPKPDPWPPR